MPLPPSPGRLLVAVASKFHWVLASSQCSGAAGSGDCIAWAIALSVQVWTMAISQCWVLPSRLRQFLFRLSARTVLVNQRWLQVTRKSIHHQASAMMQASSVRKAPGIKCVTGVACPLTACLRSLCAERLWRNHNLRARAFTLLRTVHANTSAVQSGSLLTACTTREHSECCKCTLQLQRQPQQVRNKTCVNMFQCKWSPFQERPCQLSS